MVRYLFFVAAGVLAWAASACVVRAEILDPADLTITAVSSPEVAGPGDLVILTVAMSNQGPAEALDATMSDPLPINVAFVSIDRSPPGGDWECTVPAPGASGKVSCVNKHFAARESVLFTITIRLQACAGNGVLTNIVTAASANPDPNYDDNAASAGPAVIDPGTCDDGDPCTLGDTCAPSIAYAESFDAVNPRTLPPGWTATIVIGPPSAAWTTVSTACETCPNSVFSLDAPEVRDTLLDSPGIEILTPTAQLRFMNRYDLEFAQDGGVLEVQVAGRPFVDILEAGGQFESGGYDAPIRSDQANPIGGRWAWTGFSGGFRPTIIDLPSSFAGKTVVFRWRLATDRFLGRVGQWVDSVVVTGPSVCRPGGTPACDDADACTDDACDPLTGCRHAPVVCEDGNVCTEDTCDALAGCTHTNVSGPCDDHDVCTMSSACSNGVCVGSDPITCDDGDPCTDDACDATTGCGAHSANLDRLAFSAERVDGRDLAVLAAAWFSCPGDARYDPAANIDVGGSCIDGDDFRAFMRAFGHRCGP